MADARRKRYTEEEIKKCTELIAQGKSVEECAEIIGCTRQTIHKWRNDFKRSISKARTEEIEKLRYEFGMHTDERIREIGKIKNRLVEELKGRDFSKLSTEYLIEKLPAFIDLLKKEDPNEEDSKVSNTIAQIFVQIKNDRAKAAVEKMEEAEEVAVEEVE